MPTTDTTIAERRFSMHAPGEPGEWKRGSSLIATAKLIHLRGNQRPYFSLTGEVSTAGERAHGNAQVGGCIHEIIVAAWPELAPLAAIHLSDDDGAPMHTVENAAYWMGLTKWQERDNEVLARHLRISVEDAEKIGADIDSDAVVKFVAENGISDLYVAWIKAQRAALEAKVAELRPVWKKEADEALKFLRGES